MAENLKTYLLDILSILLPGGFLMVVLAESPSLTIAFFSFFPHISTPWISSVLYVGVAYTLGHFVFFIGSFLDKAFIKVQKWVWQDNRLRDYVAKYRIEKTGIADWNVLNTFKWSCAWLLANKPEMYPVVERYVAESKFFRSLVVVFFVVSIIYAFKPNGGAIAVVSLAMLLLSLVRYGTQRQKSMETAYQFMITASDRLFDSGPGIPYRSKEIRWFFKNPHNTILNWFLSHGKADTKGESRTDYYLRLPDKEDLSVKLRDGNIEVKQRHGAPLACVIIAGAEGTLETWTKWSFDVEKSDTLAKHIISDNDHDWIEVRKKRYGIKISRDSNGAFIAHRMTDVIAAGCQIEYTILKINESDWFTFALEWFGIEDPEMDIDLLRRLLADINLNIDASMGYNEFLNKIRE